MSGDEGAVVFGAALCGLAGMLVPRLVARIPERLPVEEQGVSYAAVSRRPGLAWHCAVAAATAGGLVGWSVGWAWPLLFLLPLVLVGVTLAVVDWHTRLLPTVIIWPALAGTALLAGVAALLDADPGAWVRAAIGAAVVGGFFGLLWLVYPAGMGFGDVRLSTLLGFALGYLGWAELVTGIYAAFLMFSVPGLLLAVIRRDRNLLRTSYPFGPFLLVGALVGIAAGPWVWGHLTGP
ncbi:MULTISPECIES: prepilin peptidase [unclassified Nocardioides]|uniref:prepilin peptidase n=1 Tax=unclassified Nocardioides TaxID=2615069 RepID=UPI0036087260